MIISPFLLADLQLALRGDPHPLYVRTTAYAIAAPAREIFVCYCERRIERSRGATTWCPCGREISAEEGRSRQLFSFFHAGNAILDDIIYKEKP